MLLQKVFSLCYVEHVAIALILFLLENRCFVPRLLSFANTSAHSSGETSRETSSPTPLQIVLEKLPEKHVLYQYLCTFF